MAIEVAPLPIPSSIDTSKFSKDFGREVKGVKAGELTPDQFKEISDLLYKVRGHASGLLRSHGDCMRSNLSLFVLNSMARCSSEIRI